MHEQGIQDVVGIKKKEKSFESYGDSPNHTYSKFNETLTNNHNPHSQIKKDKTPLLK